MRSSFDVLAELFAKDVEPVLSARFQALTPAQRIAWLEEMQQFAESIRAKTAPEEHF
ncbi:MAG: hypothetical protein QM831_28870 [Kofleriaceae bacterium]